MRTCSPVRRETKETDIKAAPGPAESHRTTKGLKGEQFNHHHCHDGHDHHHGYDDHRDGPTESHRITKGQQLLIMIIVVILSFMVILSDDNV